MNTVLNQTLELASGAQQAPGAGGDAAAAAQAISAASFAVLLHKLDYLDSAGQDVVRRAYLYADQAHQGQLRSSGDPYITHPIEVAGLCAEWKLDAQALCAALLHDAMEDCGITKADLAEHFGASVAEMVDGLTKLDKLQFNTREENQAESFRKMLLAMSRDVRVILIKLADRTHNMRTLSDMPRSKWGRISSETLDIYVPLAHRLGLNQSYRELQDLAFRHLHPWRHSVLAKAVGRSRSRRRDFIGKVQGEVEAALERNRVSARLAGREKTLYAIYRKMKRKHLSFAQVTDLYGFRVIVPSITDCYVVLGVLHQLYKPLMGKFRDYIAITKINGYQSLHTSVVGPAGLNVEFQIRTEEMHVVAETGVAAHWLYKAQDAGSDAAERLGTQWLQSLLDIQNDTRDAAEFWDHVKVDLFPDAVYVFTPRSQILALPRGATVVDFAYAIHSDVGGKTTGAKINDEQVPLRTELKNGDVVEVITDSDATPNPVWLSFVRTGRARSKIRHFLKTQAYTESIGLGEKMLEQALRGEGLEQLPDAQSNPALWDKLLRFTGSKNRAELMTDLGLGKRIAHIVARRAVMILAEDGWKPDALLLSRERFGTAENAVQGAIMLDGSENTSVQYAPCCRPVPGDAIVGYLGKGEGLQVHHGDCAVAKKLQHKDGERFISVDWAEELTRPFETAITVTVNNGKGVLARIASELAATEADIIRVDMDDAMATTDLRFVIAVRNAEHVQTVLRNLQRTSCVLRAVRVLPVGG